MAGTINLALSQQFDMDGRPLSGGLLYFFVAGTSTPQTAFQDLGLTIPHPNPITLDASGRVPMFYLADGTIKIRLSDSGGATVIAADQILVMGPSSGATSSASFDPTAVLAPGDIIARYDINPKTGFVRLNGKSISKGGAGGTEMADDRLEALFEYLWTWPNITLDAAKNTAVGDWNAGRKLNLPDLRGRTIAGLDDMGSTAAGRLTTAGFGTPATVLGALSTNSTDTYTLTVNNIPAHNHSLAGLGTLTSTNSGSLVGSVSTFNSGTLGTSGGSVSHQHAAFIGDDPHTHDVKFTTILVGSGSGSTVVGSISSAGTSTGTDAAIAKSTKVRSTAGNNATADNQTQTESAHSHNFSFSVSGQSCTYTANQISVGVNMAGKSTDNNVTTGVAMSLVQPTMVMTWYMKW